ncbi:hypothetical protein GCM10020216_059090 [Nonomuraea helvata]
MRIADRTRWRVSSSTLLRLLTTRETVWLETPASAATSAMDGRLRVRRPGAVSCVAPSTVTSARPMLSADVYVNMARPSMQPTKRVEIAMDVN